MTSRYCGGRAFTRYTSRDGLSPPSISSCQGSMPCGGCVPCPAYVSGIFLLLLAGTNRTSWLYPCTQYKPSWQDGDSSRRVVFHPRAKATA
ncbi:MAG: hypothetical protein P5683_23555, partial [Limnospira sp. PMC 1279.21]|uniref:hypothetical protein n=1 Tax=unclassified Limnospira TaxID=2642885 RepID=UPI0028E0A9F1